jgi:ATP-dependent Clp protease ATP-binding subunit ClpB
VLLQVLDDGRMTDGQGRTVDFRNAVIVMTSNIGSQQIQEMTAAGAEDWEIEATVREILRRGPAAVAMEKMGRAAGVPSELRQAMSEAAGPFFRPELLNRIDEVVVFHQLRREQLGPIVEIQLERLRRRLAEREMVLKLNDEAKRQIADEGFDPAFGARPLKRVIQQRIENPLATRILSGEFAPGDTVVVGHQGKSFVFEKGS